MLIPIPARGKGLQALITGTIANLNLKTWLMSNLGWDGTTPYAIDVIVDAAAIIYASTTANYALTISGFPAGTVLNLINNGVIIGAGGAGGKGGKLESGSDYEGTTYYVRYAGSPGSPGGDAISAASPVNITNFSKIYGGGGGGGGSSAATKSGNGGGGGGGMAVGAGGSRGDVVSASYGNNGNPGTTYAGGSGGYYSWTGIYAGSISGGAGGAPGSAGATGGQYRDGQTGVTTYGGAGGAAGKYAVGNSNITWITAGDRRGGVS
jgi:hypothetical protein